MVKIIRRPRQQKQTLRIAMEIVGANLCVFAVYDNSREENQYHDHRELNQNSENRLRESYLHFSPTSRE